MLTGPRESWKSAFGVMREPQLPILKAAKATPALGHGSDLQIEAMAARKRRPLVQCAGGYPHRGHKAENVVPRAKFVLLTEEMERL